MAKTASLERVRKEFFVFHKESLLLSLVAFIAFAICFFVINLFPFNTWSDQLRVTGGFTLGLMFIFLLIYKNINTYSEETFVLYLWQAISIIFVIAEIAAVLIIVLSAKVFPSQLFVGIGGAFFQTLYVFILFLLLSLGYVHLLYHGLAWSQLLFVFLGSALALVIRDALFGHITVSSGWLLTLLAYTIEGVFLFYGFYASRGYWHLPNSPLTYFIGVGFVFGLMNLISGLLLVYALANSTVVVVLLSALVSLVTYTFFGLYLLAYKYLSKSTDF